MTQIYNRHQLLDLGGSYSTSLISESSSKKIKSHGLSSPFQYFILKRGEGKEECCELHSKRNDAMSQILLLWSSTCSAQNMNVDMVNTY